LLPSVGALSSAQRSIEYPLNDYRPNDGGNIRSNRENASDGSENIFESLSSGDRRSAFSNGAKCKFAASP
jgi:hypothetical protein